MIRRREAGYTLVELVSVVSIIGLLSTLFVINVGCVIKDVAYSDASVQMGQVHRSVTAYYKNRGELPLGNPISLSGVEESGALKSTLSNSWGISESDVDYLFSTGNVYDFEGTKLVFDGDLSREVIRDYAVIFVSDDAVGEGISRDERLALLQKFNGSVMLKRSVRNCQDDAVVIRIGNVKNDKVSESLKFDMGDGYLDCPNKSLCGRLEN